GSLAVLDSSGHVLTQSPRPLSRLPPDLGPDPSSRVFPATGDGVHAVAVVQQPIRRTAGTVAGRLPGEVELATPAPSLRAMRFGATGSAVVVDHEANILLVGNPPRRGSRIQAPEALALVRGWQRGAIRVYSPVLRRQQLTAFAPAADLPWAVFVSQ